MRKDRAPGKTRITIRLDGDVLAWFRGQVASAGGSYQTAINLALRDYIAREPLEATLRRVVREELASAAGAPQKAPTPTGRGRPPWLPTRNTRAGSTDVSLRVEGGQSRARRVPGKGAPAGKTRMKKARRSHGDQAPGNRGAGNEARRKIASEARGKTHPESRHSDGNAVGANLGRRGGKKSGRDPKGPGQGAPGRRGLSKNPASGFPKEVSLHPLAEAELSETVSYYEERLAGLGLAFLTEVEAALWSIVQYPRAAPQLRDFVRRKPLRRFPFSLMYWLHAARIRLVAVVNHRQRPEYWANRL
jgi:toxin ParE1/3/4